MYVCMCVYKPNECKKMSEDTYTYMYIHTYIVVSTINGETAGNLFFFSREQHIQQISFTLTGCAVFFYNTISLSQELFSYDS